MKNSYDRFYQWAKNELSESPSSEVDQRILQLGVGKLGNNSPKNNFLSFLKPAFAIAISLVFIIVINYNTNRPQTNEVLAIEDPTEMILQYENIELMAAAQSLSDDEWRDIEGVK